jgi:chromosome segregation ATPase
MLSARQDHCRASAGSRAFSVEYGPKPEAARDHGVMADAELDELFAAKPEDFTGLRTRLAAAAKKRGDADTAKQISAARKPTTAAWVVNRLALGDKSVKERLSDLRERLRAAHAEMDGERIRELTGQQRRLVNELTRMAIEEAELTEPSAALRDDVTGTLQAAVADPDVAARLGRLSKAERWSGFGEFGDTAMVFTTTRAKPKPEPETKPAPKREPPKETKREEARAALAAAEQAKAEADDALSELQTDLAVARLRRDDARKRLQDAERALAAAEDAYDQAKQASRDAAAVVKEAKARLR